MAYEDLNQIYDYICFHLLNPDAAENVTTAIRKTVNSLDTFPERNKIIEDDPWKKLKIRRENVKKYVICYKIDDSGLVYIVRIFYGGRDIRNIEIK